MLSACSLPRMSAHRISICFRHLASDLNSKQMAGGRVAHATLKGPSVVKEIFIGLTLGLIAGGCLPACKMSVRVKHYHNLPPPVHILKPLVPLTVLVCDTCALS